MAIGTYISIITLCVNGFNATTKRHRQAEWIQKHDPYICCLQETNFRRKGTYTLKSLAFLYANNEKTEREIKETIPFTIAMERIKY